MMITKEEQEITAVVYHYEMTTKHIDSNADMEYTTYGVRALDQEQNVVKCYADVSTNQEFVSQIVEKINRGQLDVLHLSDILTDFLG